MAKSFPFTLPTFKLTVIPVGVPSTGLYTGNDQLVGVRGEHIIVQAAKHEMTREEALLHAAWLVTLAEEKDDEFDRILTAVQK